MSLILERIIQSKVKQFFPFDNFRPKQEEAINDIIKSFVIEKKKVVFLDAPTGTGKSVIGYTVAKVLASLADTMGFVSESPNSVVLTKTKALQQQYVSTFEDMKSLWSQTSYDCHVPEEIPYVPHNTSLTTHKRCKSPVFCYYEQAKKEFNASSIGVLNYAFYNTSMWTAAKTNIVICDEAHTLDEIILNQLEVSINEKTITSRLKSPDALKLSSYIKSLAPNKGQLVPNSKVDLDYIVSCYQSSLSEFVKEIADLEEITNPSDDTLVKIGRLEVIQDYIISQISKLKAVSKDDNWVISYSGFPNVELKFKPLVIKEDTKSKVFNNKCILLMSASFCGVETLASNLLLTPDDYTNIKMDYVFPLENRPFVLMGLPSMNHGSREALLPLYTEIVDTLIDDHDEQCGIIHTVSYSNAEHLIQNSKHSARMMIPSSQDLLRIKELMKDGKILVSPAISEGIDLEGKLSEFQIFFKTPYGNLGDPWIDKKSGISPDWYSRETVMKIIQGSGRSIRNSEDACITYMLDDSFSRLLNKNSSMFPEWFLATIIGM